jgi:hypothetical protein
MAKKISSEAKKFLKELATNPDALMEFIKHPDRAMNERVIPEIEQTYIKNCVALEVSKKMIVCPDAVHVHW